MKSEFLLQWQAVYKDGTRFNEYKHGKQIPKGYLLIDRKKLKFFQLMSMDNRVIVTLELDKGKKLFYRRRVQRVILGKENTKIIYCVGYNMRYFKKLIIWIHDDYSIMVTDKWLKQEPYKKPIFLKQEKFRF